MEEAQILSVKNISHRYDRILALDDVSFSVNRGEIFGLLGPNGGGKSTLFKIIATRLLPSDGNATIDGMDILTESNHVRRKLAIVFQFPSIDEHLTVYENLKFHGMLFGISSDELSQRINEFLSKLGISERKNDLVKNLSGGMRRKVEIAKGLLSRPKIVLMDEPGTGLDPGARTDLWDIIKKLNEDLRITFLITTHLMEEAENCHRIGILNKGKLVAMGSPDSLKSGVRGELVEVHGGQPETLLANLSRDFAVEPALYNNTVYFEHEQGHQLLPKIIEKYPGLIEEVAVRQPTLGDVFLHHTGRKLENGDIARGDDER